MSSKLRFVAFVALMLSLAKGFVPTAARASNTGRSSSTTSKKMISSILDLLGGPDKKMVTPEEALPGRDKKMPNIDGLRHYVLGNKIDEVPENCQVAVFANGCFWGSEKGIWR